MYLNLYNNHFSYIKDLNKFSRSFRCGKCNKTFPTMFRQRRHSATCDAATRDIHIGGAFEPDRTIFDKLGDYPHKEIFPLNYAFFRIERVLT